MDADKADGHHRTPSTEPTANTTTNDATKPRGQQALGYEIPQWNMAYTGDYTATNTTLVSVRGGYMKDNYFDTGVNKSQTFEYATVVAVGACSPACRRSIAQPAGYSNLPRTQIKDHDMTTRNFVDLSVSQTVNAAGEHQFKGGFGYSRATNDVDLAYPNNGYVTVFWDQTYISDVPGVGCGHRHLRLLHDRRHRHEGRDGRQHPEPVRAGQLEIRSRLTLNLGVRTESEDIPSFRPDIQEVGHPLRLGREAGTAPRLRLQPLRRWQVEDFRLLRTVTTTGRSTSWRAALFGGDIWTTRYRRLDDPDPTKLSRASLDRHGISGTASPTPIRTAASRASVPTSSIPNMKPMAQDTYNLGFEYQLSTNTVVGVNFVRTNLLRTIEDIGTLVNGSEAYIYGNPGEGLGTIAIPTGATPPFDMPKAKRKYTALEFTANRRFSNNWFLSASYVLSRLYGNYPGIVNTDEFTAPGRVSVGVAGSPSVSGRDRAGTPPARGTSTR